LSKMEWAKTIWAADIIVRDQKVHLWFSDEQPAEHRRAAHIAAETCPTFAASNNTYFAVQRCRHSKLGRSFWTV
jgi:hypothetical protein